jgi:hypothetical protein
VGGGTGLEFEINGPWADSGPRPIRSPRPFSYFSFLFLFFFSVFVCNFAKQFQIGFKQPFEICKLIPSVC